LFSFFLSFFFFFFFFLKKKFIYSLDHKLENNEKNFLELENGVGKYGLITMTSSLNELTIKNTKFENFNKGKLYIYIYIYIFFFKL